MSQPRCPKHKKFLAKKDGRGEELSGHYYCSRCGFWWRDVRDGFVLPALEIFCRLPAILEEKEMSRQELSQIAGISYRETCRIVAGTVYMIRFDTILKLCRALECQPGDMWVHVARKDSQGNPL
jgi:putative transcriptional regulator